MKKMLFTVPIVALVFTSCVLVMANPKGVNDKGTKEENAFYPVETIENNDGNIYVELNNELVSAINDFRDGKITEEEYIKKCERISKQMDTDEEMKKIKEEEEKYKNEFE